MPGGFAGFDFQIEFVAGFSFPDHFDKVIILVDLLFFGGEDEIAGFKAGFCRGAVVDDVGEADVTFGFFAVDAGKGGGRWRAAAAGGLAGRAFGESSLGSPAAGLRGGF